MAVIQPFRALRPPADLVSQVASPPYDVVSTEEARELAADNPLSFLHVSRPEIDLPAGTDLYSDAVYRMAADNFEKLKKECPLTEEETPSLYLYRLIMGGHEQIGVVACCSVDEYDQNLIRKHERTRPDKEDDRTRHMLTLHSQTGPVFLTYRAQAEIDTMVLETTASHALYDFTAHGWHPAHRLARCRTRCASSRRSAKCRCSTSRTGITVRRALRAPVPT